MYIVIATNEYKGSMSAMQAASAIEQGFMKIFPEWKYYKVGIADGGDGMLEVIMDQKKVDLFGEEVLGPLSQNVRAKYGILLDEDTAIIEMAEASGLKLLGKEEFCVKKSHTRGCGQLIKAALEKGVKKVIIGAGGSASVDAGVGMLKELGVKFLDANGQEIGDGGEELLKLEHIDISNINPKTRDVIFQVACDVKTPLLGDRSAAKVFGPQKGASPENVVLLDKAMSNFAKVVEKEFGFDISKEPMGGAGGGLAAGAMVILGAELKLGIDVVSEILKLNEIFAGADLIITGEGCLDYQTSFGKAPMAVINAAKPLNIPVIIVCGVLGKDAYDMNDVGFESILGVSTTTVSDENLKIQAALDLQKGAEQIARLMRLAIFRLNKDKKQ